MPSSNIVNFVIINRLLAIKQHGDKKKNYRVASAPAERSGRSGPFHDRPRNALRISEDRPGLG
jgi:hypothetical protein